MIFILSSNLFHRFHCYTYHRRRIEKHTGIAGEPGALPETDKDRDFDRVMRVATNDDIAFLMKGGDPTQAAAKGVASEKKKVGGCMRDSNLHVVI